MTNSAAQGGATPEMMPHVRSISEKNAEREVSGDVSQRFKDGVTFLVAAKDEERSIGACILSILAVMLPEDRLIVVDDGSVDRTHLIAADLADSRTTILKNEKSLGRAGARNRALGQVSTKYVAVQDADDLALLGRRDALAAFLDENIDVHCVSGQPIAVSGGGRSWIHMTFPLDQQDVRRWISRGAMPICHTGSLFRTDAMLRSGGYDPTFVRAQDFDLVLRMSEHGDVISIPDPVVAYRHAIWLSYGYWMSSRKYSRMITSQADEGALVLWPRFIVSNCRRVARFLLTTRRATDLARRRSLQ